MKNKNIRYKHKLNMLEPGAVIVKIIGIFLLAAFLFYLIKWYLISFILLGAGGFVFLVLIILLTIEQHQDRVLYEDAKRKDKDIK